MAAEMCKMLILSTAHLSMQTLAYLNDTPQRVWPAVMDPIEYGFLLWADMDRDQGGPVPADIWSICQRAKQLGARYVKLDCDAETITGLAVYDHDAKPGTDGYSPN